MKVSSVVKSLTRNLRPAPSWLFSFLQLGFDFAGKRNVAANQQFRQKISETEVEKNGKNLLSKDFSYYGT